MKVKLDENIPTRAVPVLERLGHDVDTIIDEGLAGADDPTVATTATGDGRLVITLDRGFGDIRRYPPGSHAGILVLRIDDHAASAVEDALESLGTTADLDNLAGCVAVWRDGDLRIRRPSGP